LTDFAVLALVIAPPHPLRSARRGGARLAVVGRPRVTNEPVLRIDWRVSLSTVSQHRDAEASVLADVRDLPAYGLG